ncbi:MAG: hypothetical protein QOG62_408 [Thermoleophilaceae bacterium]|jgi:hypothetical protein|nr:hypothetical protein [Thermoleophilaceae bacterium]
MRWAEIESEVPDLAGRAKAYFDGHVHKTLATIRRDGSPRISGTEVNFRDGELFIGSMLGAMKALDLARDPRFAIHSGSDDPDDGWTGDAKVAGRMEEITDPARIIEVNGEPNAESHLFRADISELVVVGLNEDRTKMVVESWHESRGLRRLER